VAEPLTLTFAPTRAEYVAGARAEPNRLLRVGMVAGAGLFASGLAAKTDLLTGLGITTLVVGLAAFALPYWRWSTSPALQEEETWTIDDLGCTIERTGSKTRNAWSFYTELIDAGRVFALLDGRARADALPKRAFASEADEQRFIALSREHVAVREAGQATNTGWTD
jgi:hypothetical protein